MQTRLSDWKAGLLFSIIQYHDVWYYPTIIEPIGLGSFSARIPKQTAFHQAVILLFLTLYNQTPTPVVSTIVNNPSGLGIAR